MTQQGRRRIDRIAAADFLDGIEERPTDEIRTMRDECRLEEERLSYERRLLQGRIDIVRAEQARREGGDEGGLVDALPGILADDARSRSSQPLARLSPVYMPDPRQGRRSEDIGEISLGQLPDLDDAALDELVGRLVADERAISDLRRRVLDHLDRLQTEVATRVQGGSLGVDDILRASGWGSRDDQR